MKGPAVITLLMVASMAAAAGILYASLDRDEETEEVRIRQAESANLTISEVVGLVQTYINDDTSGGSSIANDCGLRDDSLEQLLLSPASGKLGQVQTTPSDPLESSQPREEKLDLKRLLDKVGDITAAASSIGITYRGDLWVITTPRQCVFTVNDRTGEITGP